MNTLFGVPNFTNACSRFWETIFLRVRTMKDSHHGMAFFLIQINIFAVQFELTSIFSPSISGKRQTFHRQNHSSRFREFFLLALLTYHVKVPNLLLPNRNSSTVLPQGYPPVVTHLLI